MQLTLVGEARQRGIDIGLRAGKRQRIAVIGAAADGSRSCQGDVQCAVNNRQLRADTG